MGTVAVLGAGSWGTALAKLLADKGEETRLWARRDDQAEDINARRENATYLPGFTLPETLTATSDLEAAVAGAGMIVSVVPTHGLRQVLTELAPMVPKGVPVVSATKGVENSTLMLVSEIFEELLPEDRHEQLTFLGGPSFAKEVAQGVPTAVSIAGKHHGYTEQVQLAFTTERFRAYNTEDVVGVELGGALKNVVAIAAGISDGLGFGHNARAALITRGLAETSRLAISLGANPLTMAGLSGMGDLVLTCTGDLSRNRSVGLELGKGRKIDDILAGMTMVAEGVRTAKSAYALSQREHVDMPITEQVFHVLYDGRPAMEAVVDLMTRPPRHERE